MRSENISMKSGVAGLITCVLLTACSNSDDVAESTMAVADPTESVGSPRTFDMPYLMRELDNGLRVIIVKTDYPDIVTLQTPVQTGSRNEVEPGKTGFAHFFEHMMFRGTEQYSAAEYSAVRKKAGANSNAFTTDDYTKYYVTFTKADLEKMIEVEADRFRNLAYSESDFRTEALAVKGEYLKNYSNPVMKAFERTRALSFDVHPYSHTTMGFIEDIESMPDQFEYSREFFDRWYRPEYTSVIIVGDVDPEDTFSLVEKYWSGWERGSYVADIPAEPLREGPVYEHIQWDSETQPWLFIGFRSPAFRPDEKDYPAMTLLSAIYFSDSSDLYQKIVLEEQLADQLHIDFPLNKDPNLNLIYVRLTDEAHAADVESAVLNTIARMRTELVATDTLVKTKTRQRYSFLANLDNSHSIGSMLADYVQFDRTPETVNDMYATFEQLTAEEVRFFADKYFTDQSRVTVSLSNSPSIDGIGTRLSLDELAAARSPEKAPVAPDEGGLQSVSEAAFEFASGSVPVSIVAQQSDSSPLVDVSIIVHAGAAMDPAGKKGLASLTAAMLTDGGSVDFSIQQINDAMYPIASGFTAQVDKEMTRLSGQVHKDNLDTWYRYVRSQFIRPGWHAQDFERAKNQLSNEVRTSLVANNDEELGKEVLYNAIYGAEHPYGSLNLGHSGDIAGLTLDDVQNFYAKYYVVNNMTVGVSGGYSDAFLARLASDLQTLPAGARASIDVPAVPAAEKSSVTIVEKETPAVAVSFGFPIDLKRGDPDWLALWLARSWLGEHRSEAAHLFQRIREERGMNYGDYAYIEYFPRGMFRMTPGTNLGRQQQIFQVWIRPLRNNNDAHFATRTAVHELEKLVNEGLSETDFEATRSFLAKSVSLLTDGQSRQLGYALDSQYYGIDNFADYVRAGLDGLTLADVNRVIRENLRADNMQYVFVTRDAEDLRERLADDLPSPVSYDAEKPAELLEEDRAISGIPLQLREADIVILNSGKVFN
jgi:zinc protease